MKKKSLSLCQLCLITHPLNNKLSEGRRYPKSILTQNCAIVYFNLVFWSSFRIILHPIHQKTQQNLNLSEQSRWGIVFSLKLDERVMSIRYSHIYDTNDINSHIRKHSNVYKNNNNIAAPSLVENEISKGIQI